MKMQSVAVKELGMGGFQDCVKRAQNSDNQVTTIIVLLLRLCQFLYTQIYTACVFLFFFYGQINKAQKALNMFIHLLSRRIFQKRRLSAIQQTLCMYAPHFRHKPVAAQLRKENTLCHHHHHQNAHVNPLFKHITTSFWLLCHRIYFIANSTQHGCLLYQT